MSLRKKISWLLQTVTLSLLLIGSLHCSGQDEIRYALVIGNQDYPKEIGALLNPVNDALGMAEELKRARFEVQLVTNATYVSLREAVKSFVEKMQTGPKGKVVGLFYYAGHGVQYQGENYIVPIDARVQYEDDIVRTCFAIQRIILKSMDVAEPRMKIIILDACRNNPFPATTRSLGNGGLVEMNARGAFLAYATAPGSVASDGTGKNGLYTQELIKALNLPGLQIEQVFKEVRKNVLHLSNERQYTWDSSNIIGDFYFNGPENKVTLPKEESIIPQADPQGNNTRSIKKVVSEEALSLELTGLTNPKITFKTREEKEKSILKYFVVPYATTYILLGSRIDERLTASKLLERLVTLPESKVKVMAMEVSDSGRIIELSIEIE